MNLYSYILKSNQNHKNRQAMSMTMASGEVRKYTYEALFNEANVYSQKMMDAGIIRGDRIAIVAENSMQWQIAFLAIMQIQGTAVLINASLPEESLKETLKQADARCIFASITVKEKLGDGSNYRVPMFNLSKDGAVFEDSFSVLSPFVARTKDPMPEVAMIFFEGNVKEEIKGAMYTHEAMIQQVNTLIREQSLSRNEHILSIISNSKIEGMVSGVLSTMLIGATIHYVESLDYESLSRTFKEFKPSIFVATPGVLKQLKEQIETLLEDNPNYKSYLEKCEMVRERIGARLANVILKQIILTFGGRLEMIWCYSFVEEEIMQFYYALGLDIMLQYGRLETNSPVLGHRGDQLERGTYGNPYPGMEIELRQPNLNRQGEMYIKSPYGMVGYFRNPEAYEMCIKDGWFKTGDLAELTFNGNIRLLYRGDLQEEEGLKDLGGLAHKTNMAYYWFNAWKKTAQCLYKVTITNEGYLPERKGCIIYSPFETTKGYLGLTMGYSKERFFKFGYLTNTNPSEKNRLEEVFGKIYYSSETLDESVKRICMEQLAKGWALIIKAPKDALNADFTQEVIALAKEAEVPIIPAYLEGEEAVFSDAKNTAKVFNLQAKKRYSLNLRYGRPIEIDREDGMIKRKIQESFISLIENQPQEEEEVVDEVTQLALQMLSPAKKYKKSEEAPIITIEGAVQEQSIEEKEPDDQYNEMEELTERIDLSDLLAIEEEIM